MPPERPAGTDPPRPGSQRRFYGPKLAGDGRPCSAGRPPWPGLVLAMRGGRGRGIGGLEARRDGVWTAAWRRRWPGDVGGWRRRRPEHPTAAAARHRGRLGSPNPNRRPFIGRRRHRAGPGRATGPHALAMGRLGSAPGSRPNGPRARLAAGPAEAACCGCPLASHFLYFFSSFLF